MATNISGSDAISKEVSSLITLSQSQNETNLSKSLNTRVATATSAFTASSDAVFGASSNVSSKVKTFSVNKVKQVVAYQPPAVIANVKDEINSLGPAVVAKLSEVSGMAINSDADLEVARKLAVSKASSITSSMVDLTSLNDYTSYSFPVGDYFNTENFATDASIFNERADASSMFGSSFSFPSFSNVNLPDVSLIPYVGNMTKSLTGAFGIGASLGGWADKLNLMDYTSIGDDLNGTLGLFNTCPDLSNLFGGGLFDLQSILDALARLLGFGFDLSCFTDVLGNLDSYSLNGLLDSAVGYGDIGNVTSLVGYIGPENITDPYSLIQTTMRNKSPEYDRYGNTTDIPDFNSKVDGLIGAFSLPRESVFGGIGDDILNIKDINSYPDNGMTSYSHGSSNKNFLKSLPFFS